MHDAASRGATGHSTGGTKAVPSPRWHATHYVSHNRALAAAPIATMVWSQSTCTDRALMGRGTSAGDAQRRACKCGLVSYEYHTTAVSTVSSDETMQSAEGESKRSWTDDAAARVWNRT